MECYSLCCGEYSQHLPTEARTRRVFGSHFEWRWCCGPTPDRFWEKFNLLTVTDCQRETGVAKVRPSWLPSWTIRLRRQQNSVCVLHNLACTMIEKPWRGISALFLVAPNPGFSIQNCVLCWHQPYTKTTSSPLSLMRHTSHTNGGFAYTGLVINFNKYIYFDISSVRDGWAGA